MATNAVTPAEPVAIDAGSPAEPVTPVTSANDAAQAVRPEPAVPDDDAKLYEALGITDDATTDPAAEPAVEATNITPEYLASL